MLTVREFSEESGLKLNKVYYFLRSGVLRSKKIGKYRMIYPEQLDIDFNIEVQPGYITFRQAAKILDITPQSVDSRVRNKWYEARKFNNIMHVNEEDIRNENARPKRKQPERKKTKKTLRKCSCCGQNTYNRMLCSTCFRNADEEVIY